MHKLFEQVFEKRDLSKAGDLFSLEDSVIVDELSDVIKTIQVMIFFSINIKYTSTIMKAEINRNILPGYIKQARVLDKS